MNEKTPAEQLRAAAIKLRDTAKAATSGPWVAYATPGPRVDDDCAWTLGRPYCEKGSPQECEPECGVTVLTTGSEGCENDNVSEGDAKWMELANPLLAEPLATWLEKTATQWADDTYLDESEHTDNCGPGWSMCKGHAHEQFCDRCSNPLKTGAAGDRCTCWDAALAVARTILGIPADSQTGGAR